MSKIFLEREMDYYIYDTVEEVNAKALEIIEEDKPMPYYLTGYILFHGRVYDKLMDVFENVENIEKRKFYGEDVLVAKTIKSYIVNKRKVLRMIEDYKESLVNKETFDEWLDDNKDNYMIQIEVKE